MTFVTVVPSIRTIPGVEEFDYAVDDSCELEVGDLIRVPFRSRKIPACVTRLTDTSRFKGKILQIDHPQPFLKLGEIAVQLLERTARSTFTSKPTVLNAWIRSVPIRATLSARIISQRQLQFAERTQHTFIDRWHDPGGIIATTKRLPGKKLILTPWQQQAELLAKEAGGTFLHGGLVAGACWKAISGFIDGSIQVLVTTRVGAWLASVADSVLIDEPENDDFKQDESSPRFDARWIVSTCAAMQPKLGVFSFGTTPRLQDTPKTWDQVPEIPLDLHLEPWVRRGASFMQALSQTSLQQIEEAIGIKRPVIVLHPIQGERARLSCRDCGWKATCPSCDFPVSLVRSSASNQLICLCRRCGKRSAPPDLCPSCGGSDLSGGRPGKDQVLNTLFPLMKNENLRVLNLSEFYRTLLPAKSLVVLTDLGLIGGAAEDVRRKERMAIAWRRLAALVYAADGQLIVHGAEETLAECRNWLTPQDLKRLWEQEIRERQSFGFPPAVRLTKLIISGDESAAQRLFDELAAHLPSHSTLHGPYPVAFRPHTRLPRFILHLVSSIETSEDELIALLEPFKKKAIIDLDPVAFFS